jgi:hypothetical protein
LLVLAAAAAAAAAKSYQIKHINNLDYMSITRDTPTATTTQSHRDNNEYT